MVPMRRTIGYCLYVVWCLSWLPTVVGLLSEHPGEKPAPQEVVIRHICLANAAAFYLGGILWLAKQCSGRNNTNILLAWVVFVFFNGWGPVALALSGFVLGPRPQEYSEEWSAPEDQPYEGD